MLIKERAIRTLGICVNSKFLIKGLKQMFTGYIGDYKPKGKTTISGNNFMLELSAKQLYNCYMCRENTIRITPAKQKSYFTSYLITREMFEKHFDYENPKRTGKKTYIKAINENE
ncbi:MAG: hypothetical protein U0L73_12485 [Ruminococcus bromii]|nr:hypothetical protein [Ruminococcus bromii]